MVGIRLFVLCLPHFSHVADKRNRDNWMPGRVIQAFGEPDTLIE